MNSNYSIPPLRDLPPDRLAERRQQLLTEISSQHERHQLLRPSRWRPVYTLTAAVVALGAIAAPTLALSASVREFVGLSSPHPLFAQARLLVSAPAPHHQVLRLYTAPSTGGGECWFVGVGSGGRPTKPNDRRGGGCTLPGGSLHPTKLLPLQMGMSQIRRPNGPGIRTWIPADVSGWVNPTLHATRIELVWQHGHQRLAFANEYFLAATPILYSPPLSDLPFYVVAYNASGREVARHKLDNATLYIDWKRNHVQAKLRAYWKAHGRP